jgi:hypothetical protein
VAQQIREVVKVCLLCMSSKRYCHIETGIVYKLPAMLVAFDLLIQEYRVACRDRCPEEPALAQEIKFRLRLVWGDDIVIDESP